MGGHPDGYDGQLPGKQGLAIPATWRASRRHATRFDGHPTLTQVSLWPRQGLGPEKLQAMPAKQELKGRGKRATDKTSSPGG